MSEAQSAVVSWLLTSDQPWVVFRTLVDVVGEPEKSADASKAYDSMRKHPRVAALINALDPWPPAEPLTRAYDPKDSIWKLGTLADFGMRSDDKRIAAIAERVFSAQAVNGGFLHGGFDHTKTWNTRPYICISHVMTYALARFGYAEDKRLQRAYEHIVEWQRDDGGWHPNEKCLPGGERADEPSCPFGTLNLLRALAAHPDHASGKPAKRAIDFVFNCWDRRAEPFRPVGFGTGTTYLKVQYPFVQWQLLKTVDTLAMMRSATKDSRFAEMLDVLAEKRNPDGTWTAESINKSWAEFDFAQKKSPSAWVTLLAHRAMCRGGATTGKTPVKRSAAKPRANK